MGRPHSTVQTPGLHPGLPSETRCPPGALLPGTRPPSSETASLGLPSPLGETGMILGGKSLLKVVHVVLYMSIFFPIRGTSRSNVGSSTGKHKTPLSLLASPWPARPVLHPSWDVPPGSGPPSGRGSLGVTARALQCLTPASLAASSRASLPHPWSVFPEELLLLAAFPHTWSSCPDTP